MPQLLGDGQVREIVNSYMVDNISFMRYFNGMNSISPTPHNVVDIFDEEIVYCPNQFLSTAIISPIPDRRPPGRATVPRNEFSTNFGTFTGGRFDSFCEGDWANVIVAGSAVLSSIMPSSEPEEFAQSDINIFFYGLSEPACIQKLFELAGKFAREEMNCVRTSNCLTFVFCRPQRQVKVHLRSYTSITEILTSFDLPSCCFAYDGKTVLSNPRGMVALATQSNIMDVSRSHPTFETRLWKYRSRGFDIVCDGLDRDKIRNIDELAVGMANLLQHEKAELLGWTHPPHLLQVDANFIPNGTPEDVQKYFASQDQILNTHECNQCYKKIDDVPFREAICGHMFHHGCEVPDDPCHGPSWKLRKVYKFHGHRHPGCASGGSAMTYYAEQVEIMIP
ncbi:hypothetical protein DFH27DRAFT_521680 [Peziza echinospora]|nr:hypothetical protein DFH27DRAFT_521680 [Peziza echinospora]